jgi:hypothetical protein
MRKSVTIGMISLFLTLLSASAQSLPVLSNLHRRNKGLNEVSMRRKWLAVGIILLFIGTGILPFISSCSAESDEYYFENVNVIIFGRCRDIRSEGTWIRGLFIGTSLYPSVGVGDTHFEKLRVKIYNESIFNPWKSFSGLINTVVCMHDAKGIFFYGCWKHYSARWIPPIVFVLCHAQEVWVR